jgi:hypothetical protein
MLMIVLSSTGSTPSEITDLQPVTEDRPLLNRITGTKASAAYAHRTSPGRGAGRATTAGGFSGFAAPRGTRDGFGVVDRRGAGIGRTDMVSGPERKQPACTGRRGNAHEDAAPRAGRAVRRCGPALGILQLSGGQRSAAARVVGGRDPGCDGFAGPEDHHDRRPAGPRRARPGPGHLQPCRRPGHRPPPSHPARPITPG